MSKLFDDLSQQTAAVRNKYDNWIYTGVYGSQNYKCDWAGSDVDTKSIVGLSFQELVQRKDINKSIETIPGSTDNLADVKDIHSMFGNFLKSNINFLEILCTEHYFRDRGLEVQIDKMRSLADQCTYYNMKQLVHATVGQFRMKCAALEKPFESKLMMIERYGYDPKQLSSAVRLVCTLKRLLNIIPLKQAINLEDDKEAIISIKANPPSLDYARSLVTEMTEYMDAQIDAVKDAPSVGFTSPSEELQTLEEDIYRILLSRHLTGRC